MNKKHAYHGGAFFGAIGNDFATLDNSQKVIAADTLDARFDPSPHVIKNNSISPLCNKNVAAYTK